MKIQITGRHMKLKDLMPLTNEQQSLSSSKGSNKNISNAKASSLHQGAKSREIVNTYHQVILKGYKKLKDDELEILQVIIYRLEKDPTYIPSISIANFAKFMLQIK
jgi:hypothetical protein